LDAKITKLGGILFGKVEVDSAVMYLKVKNRKAGCFIETSCIKILV